MIWLSSFIHLACILHVFDRSYIQSGNRLLGQRIVAVAAVPQFAGQEPQLAHWVNSLRRAHEAAGVLEPRESLLEREAEAGQEKLHRRTTDELELSTGHGCVHKALIADIVPREELLEAGGLVDAAQLAAAEDAGARVDRSETYDVKNNILLTSDCIHVLLPLIIFVHDLRDEANDALELVIARLAVLSDHAVDKPLE